MPGSLAETAVALLSCVEAALDADLRPVCKAYQSVGTPVIYTCCECDEGTNGELSIHFRRLYDAEANTLNEVRRIRPCKGGITAAQYRLVLARCFPTVDEKGELPDHTVIEDTADDLQRDAELVWQSLACCSGMALRIDDISVDLGPKGGCSVVYADVTAQVIIPMLPDTSSG